MIYIIIPVYNRKLYTQTCLKSLYSQTFKNFTVVVVDHGSTDGTSQMIVNEFPQVTLLHGDETMWWAAATNFGVKKALEKNPRFILTLNNDTVPQPNYLEELLAASEIAPQYSLIGSTAINLNTNENLFSGDSIDWFSWLTETSKVSMSKASENKKNIVEITRYPGRGLLIPTVVFNKIGLYDDVNFPHYMSDYDFTLRAHKAGFKIFRAEKAFLGIYPEASGANLLVSKKSFKNYYKHLFGMKGGANLPLFYKYAFRHCPLYALPTFLFLGTVRRLTGYWIKS